MKRAKGNGQFAHIIITLEPGERDSGFVFETAVKGGVVPKEYFPSIKKGIESAATSGPILGCPVVDFKVTLTGGSFHEQDSSGYAFQIAGHQAFKKAIEQAGPRLLEPIMNAEITVPSEFIGGVIGDLHSRRGKIVDMSFRDNEQIINASLPLSETFGYITKLRSITQGQGTCSLEFSKWEFVPGALQEKIISEYKCG